MRSKLIVSAFLVMLLAFLFAISADAVTTSVTKLSNYMPEWIVYRVDVTLDASYPSNGETLSLGSYLPKISAAWLSSGITDPGGHAVVLVDSTWASGTMKVKIFSVSADTLTEISNADTTLVNEKVTLFIAGRK